MRRHYYWKSIKKGVRMFKTLILPLQMWLLGRGQCVGCGRKLAKGEKVTNQAGQEKIICQCGRIFIHEKGTYRRALFSEV